MLGQKMCGNGMPTPGNMVTKQQIENRSPTHKIHGASHKCDLYEEIQQMPTCKRLWADNEWAQSVKPGLIKHEKPFSKSCAEKFSLDT
jgi:hypothetical protein